MFALHENLSGIYAWFFGIACAISHSPMAYYAAFLIYTLRHKNI